MNICFVNSTRKWGGVKTWTLDLALGLTKHGHHPLIMARPGVFLDKIQSSGLQALPIIFGPDFNPILIFKLMRLFRERSIDLVLVNVGKDMRTAGVAAKLLGIPVVHRVGLAGDMKNTTKVRWIHRWVRPQILVPCQQIKQGLLRNLPYLEPEEIRVILTGKTPAPHPPAKRHRPLRFISTSQLNADKGHEDILKAFGKLKGQGLDFEYHIVGTGRVEAKLRGIAQKLGLDSHIAWHGFQKDVRALLQKADVFLLPSYSEGLPNSLLEAMSEGLICVARKVGGIAEVWPASAGHLLLPQTALPEDFSSVLSQLIGSPDNDLGKTQQNFHALAQNNSYTRMLTAIETFFLESI